MAYLLGWETDLEKDSPGCGGNTHHADRDRAACLSLAAIENIHRGNVRYVRTSAGFTLPQSLPQACRKAATCLPH